MVIRFAENIVAAYFDKQAIELIKRAAALETQADKTRSTRLKEKYRKYAQKLRKDAIAALENAKNAAAKK